MRREPGITGLSACGTSGPLKM
ncbi:lipoprotein [uncultured Flavonifractor sp.]